MILTDRDLRLVETALRDGICYQRSIADAHHYSINSWERTNATTTVARVAVRLSNAYRRLEIKRGTRRKP